MTSHHLTKDEYDRMINRGWNKTVLP